MLVNGHTRDVQIDANGTVLEIEQQEDSRALPADVQAGRHAKAGKGNMMKVESFTKKDKLVAYEAKVMADGKNFEGQLGANEKPLDHEA